MQAFAACKDVEESGSSAAGFGPEEKTSYEDASRYCPVCSQRLESRRGKLVCNVCGYYMSLRGLLLTKVSGFRGLYLQALSQRMV